MMMKLSRAEGIDFALFPNERLLPEEEEEEDPERSKNGDVARTNITLSLSLSLVRVNGACTVRSREARASL